MTAPLIIPEYQSNGQVTFGEQGFEQTLRYGLEMFVHNMPCQDDKGRPLHYDYPHMIFGRVDENGKRGNLSGFSLNSASVLNVTTGFKVGEHRMQPIEFLAQCIGYDLWPNGAIKEHVFYIADVISKYLTDVFHTKPESMSDEAKKIHNMLDRSGLQIIADGKVVLDAR